jgi:hypothetical protein
VAATRDPTREAEAAVGEKAHSHFSAYYRYYEIGQVRRETKREKKG